MRCSGPTTTSSPTICRTLMDKYNLCKLFFVFLVFFFFHLTHHDETDAGQNHMEKRRRDYASDDAGAMC